MGEKSHEIHKVTREYIKKEYLKEPKTFKADEEFLIGDIKITPYLCDHSAFDAYMFLLDCEGKRYYTQEIFVLMEENFFSRY